MKLCVFSLILFIAYSASAQVSIELSEQAKIYNPKNGEYTRLPASSKTKLPVESFLWLLEDNKVPVLIIQSKENDHLQISPPSLRRDLLDNFSQSTDQALSDILEKFVSVQSSILNSQKELAMVQLNQLIAKYPNVSFLNFLAASVYYVNSKPDIARNFLEKGLVHHPDYKPGKDLMEKINEELR